MTHTLQLDQAFFNKATHVLGFVAATNEDFMRTLCGLIAQHPSIKVRTCR